MIIPDDVGRYVAPPAVFVRSEMVGPQSHRRAIISVARVMCDT